MPKEIRTNPGIVMTLGYTDGNELKDIPPKGAAPEGLKTELMTQEKLKEFEEAGHVLLIGKALTLSTEETMRVTAAKKQGITDVASAALHGGKATRVDEGR